MSPIKKSDESVGLSFNYSNILSEVYGDQKRVYIQTFGFRQLDEAAEKTYNDSGFQTVTIKGLLTNALSMEKGR